MASRFLTEVDKNELANKIPSKTSQLSNDSKFQTEDQVKASIDEALKDIEVDVNLDDYALKEDIPTKISQLENDSGFLTQHQDLSDIKESINRKANEIVATVTGEQFVVTDSTNEKLRGMKLFGKSEQTQYSGKNLCNITIKDQTISGITFTVNDDKSITLNGTCTNDIYLNVGVALLEGSVEYRISGCPKFNVWNDAGFYINSDAASGNVWDRGESSTFVMTNTQEYPCSMQIRKDVVMTNRTFYPMIKLSSNTDSMYEPYTGGIPSPNPQYPQEITSVGDDGSVGVGVYGKNLIDVNDLISNAENTVTVKENGVSITSITSAWYSYYSHNMRLKPNTKYTIVAKVRAITNDVFRRIRALDSKGTVLKSESINTDGYVKTTFTTTDGNVVIQLGVNNESGMQQIDYNDIVLSVGDVDVSYEPYNTQSLIISTPNGLRGIKVNDPSIANYTDSDGNMWCCDEIDLERGKYVQRVGEMYFTGNETWTKNADSKDKNFRVRCESKPLNDAYIYEHTVSAMSNIAYSRSWTELYINCLSESVSIQPNMMVNFSFQKDSFVDAEDWKRYVSEQYQEGSPVIVHYILVEPIETDLTSEQLEAYKLLHTNYPNTTITSDAFVKVDYLADTKHYIDNKFAELATALVAMGGV